MKNIFLLKYLFFLCIVTSSYANDHRINIDELYQEYDYGQSKEALEVIRDYQNIPYIDVEDLQDQNILINSNQETREAVTTSTKDIFYNIQSKFFNHEMIDLRFCTSECGFSAEYQDSEVLFELKLIKEIMNDERYQNPEDVITYISAHEISHFIHEMTTHPPFSLEDGHSLHNNPSVYQDLLSIEINNLSEAQQYQLYHTERAQEIIDEITAKNLSKYLRTHAEVDMYATLVLIQNDFKGWDDVYLFIENFIKNETEHNIVLDFINRKRVIKETIHNFSK